VGEVSYKGHRYPAEIIAHCVWLYHRFPLSFREVEELMLVRGVIVTYDTIGQWCAKFGPGYAAGLRRRQPRPGDKWHLDEVFLTINGRRHYLWRGTVNLRSCGRSANHISLISHTRAGEWWRRTGENRPSDCSS
jgi:transposase-like protein